MGGNSGCGGRTSERKRKLRTEGRKGGGKNGRLRERGLVDNGSRRWEEKEDVKGGDGRKRKKRTN